MMEQGKSATFTAQSNEPSRVNWSATGGSPANGKGTSFSTQFGGPGHYTVTASCKNSQNKIVDVGVSCPVAYALDVFKATPSSQNAFGSTSYTNPRPDLKSCARGTQACIGLVAFHQGLEKTVPSSIAGKTNITGADDAAIDATNCSQIIADFTPFDPCKGPPRTSFWVSRFTEFHEKRHYDDVLILIKKTAEDDKKYLAGECKQCLKDLAGPQAIIQGLRDIFIRNQNAYELTKECLAHGVSNPLYEQLINDIKTRAKKEGWQQCQ